MVVGQHFIGFVLGRDLYGRHYGIVVKSLDRRMCILTLPALFFITLETVEYKLLSVELHTVFPVDRIYWLILFLIPYLN